MAIKRLVPADKAAAVAKAKASELAVRGKPSNVLTPLEKDEILLTMAEALGFYKP
jgi:hypothetical protein